MNGKHSPRPWSVGEPRPGILGPMHQVVDGDGKTIALTGYLDRTESLPNAYLFSAVLDLLDATENLVSVVEQLIPEPSARGVADVVLAQARTAIAKARGK